MTDLPLLIQRSYTTNEGKPAVSEPKTERGKLWVTLPNDAMAVLAEHRERQRVEHAALGLPVAAWA